MAITRRLKPSVSEFRNAALEALLYPITPTRRHHPVAEAGSE